MKRLNPRYQNLLPFFPESEYYHQNGNFHPQHSTKLIDVTHVLAFDIMRKQVFRINDLRYKFDLNHFPDERVKSEASEFYFHFVLNPHITIKMGILTRNTQQN